jgi:chromosomal replication initiation ATPase DnaA
MKTQLDSRVDNLIKAIDEKGGDRAKLDFPLRTELLKLKSEIAGLNLPEEVINFVARKVDSNVRDLENFSTDLIAHAVSQRKPIDTRLVRRFYESKKKKSR